MLKTNRSILILLLVVAPLLLPAQPIKSLKDCIAYGLENHLSKQIYANERLAASAKSREARAGYLPAVNINGALDDNLKVQETVIPAGLFSPTDIRVAFTKKFATNVSAQLDQTIYDQSLITGLKANKYNAKQAALNETLNNENIVYNICAAYYQIFTYREQLFLLRTNLESFAEQLKISALKVDKGVATEVDLNKVQVNYNNTRSQILVAESNLQLSENQLKNAMGYPLEAPIHIDTVASNKEQSLFLIDNAFSQFQPETRTDYQLSDVNISMLDIDQKRIRAGIFPRLTAYARYGGNGFGDNLDQSFSSITDFSAIGLKLNIPLFDGLKRNAQYHQANYKWLNAIKNLELDKAGYKLDFENNRTKLLKAKASMDNDRRNIELAQSVFKSTDLQYQKGVTDLTDWLNAQSSLKEAQSNYLNSLYNFYIAGIELEKAKGTLIQFYNAL
jgi:outer membrane protein